MRLLDTSTFELRSGEQPSFKEKGYAILSHRWVGLEVTFEQLSGHTAELRTGTRPLSTPQLDKIRGACETAREQGIRWMWIDTCCISKASTVEETESINSMFRWYRDARVCITYLSDVRKEEEPAGGADTFRSAETGGPSVWFSRGWTLQELLAPRDMQFYDTEWNYLGTRAELAGEIAGVTGIEARYLTGARSSQKACIAVKMSWMAGRETAREEDVAYSMLGIFNITMGLQYSEGGARAFARLQEALLAKTMDESLFAWRMPGPRSRRLYMYNLNLPGFIVKDWAPDDWGLLAPSPEWFRGCGSLTIEGGQHAERPGGGFLRIQQGTQAYLSSTTTTPRDPVKGLPHQSPAARQLTAGLLAMTFVLLPFAFWYGHHYDKEGARERLWLHREPFVFTLNCWHRDGQGRLGAVQVHLRTCSPTSAYMVKRIRCTEYGVHYGEIFTWPWGQGVVVQPEPDHMY
ncbi:hypothetical protein VPNG_03344 [Cytospora leucostoma]|uniref:Uncharacterized protein n=1 Tax=Cytospora leucostoma TaxID=1230097 RepID=A0A423XFH7_9PEZI|nr:hypothetical protein VPNG_03344 [Cytospora leucostoma]